MSATFFCAMAAGLFLSLSLRNWAMLRTVLTILAAWGCGTFYRLVIVPDSDWPWLYYAALDAISAAIIIRHPANKWQGWIGLCFLVQFAANIGYGANYIERGYDYDAAVLAWSFNGWVGHAKLILLAGWGGAAIAGYLRGRTRVLFHPAPRHFHSGKAE